MAYRGEDLDLRTLQSWTSQGRELQDLFTTGPMTGSLRTRPIYVDDTVIACLNDAYELATAHRSGEIRLEHLLNAMTRVEAATKIMELSGVRVTTLRRETGTIIASELPVAYSNGKSSPRTGTDVEDVLRLAAERAYTRRQMVAVEDLLDVLGDANRELPAIQVLRRHWNGRPLLRDNGLVAGAPLPLPPLGRPYGNDEPRERIRVQAPMSQVRTAYVAEPARTEVQQVMTDQLQNTRIETLERLVRQLADELNADRKGMSAAFSDIQRDLGAARDESARFRGGLTDRLKSMEMTVSQSGAQALGASPQMLDRLMAVERSLEAKFNDLARSWTALGEKLQTLEYSVGQVRMPDGPISVDTKPIERQLTDVARTLAAVNERIGQLERTTSRAQPASNEPLLERLAQIERAMQNGMGEGARNWAAMGERMKTLEKSVTSRASDAVPAQLLERLESLERTMTAAQRNGAHAAPLSFAPVLERIMLLERGIEARNTEAMRTVGQVETRVRGLEEQFGAQRSAMGDLASRLGADIKSAVATIGATQAQGERTQAGMFERVQGLLGGFDRSRGELITAVAQPVSERMTQGLTRLEQLQGQTSEGVRQMLGQLLAQVSSRMSQVEGQLTTLVAREEQTSSTHDKDLIELHDALVKINGNQQTLATSLDQWRLDTAGDLSVINTRIETLEKLGEAPARQMLALTTEVQSMHALQLKREARKSRFRMWLFGTEDWFGDSWERQTERTAASITAASAAAPKSTGFKFLRR